MPNDTPFRTPTPRDHQARVAFYLTGRRTGDSLHALDETGLRPALLCGYRDLTRLRYDYPIVLMRRDAKVPYASLSSIIDGVIEKLAQKESAEAVRKPLLRLEREIRELLASGMVGTLTKLWERAALELSEADRSLAPLFERARAALDWDGQLADCDSTLGARLFVRAWRFVQDEKTRQSRAQIDRLILKLSEILRADFVGSDAGRRPEQLQATVGGAFQSEFDFSAMSTMLASVPCQAGLTPARRRRIEHALTVLQSQRFFASAVEHDRNAPVPYSFVFASCGDVEEAYSERLPKMVELVKAMAIAELEIRGEYNEAHHDAFFDAFGRRAIAPEELARFPDYLLCLYARAADEYGGLMSMLSANVPVKVLVHFDDIFEASPVSDGQPALSLCSKQLADMAMGQSNVYVLQSPASNLVQMRERVLKGMWYGGPALFSVYSGATANAAGLPPYLLSAAALESRAFPAFVYDPSAGEGWAARFSIAENPQPERDWPAQRLAYEDRDHQRMSDAVEFTLADFMACDARYASHFAKVPAPLCNGDMTPVAEWLARKTAAVPDGAPYLMMAGENDALHKVIADDAVIEETRRCREIWHSLQELGGIHNSHAERLLAREKRSWDEQKQREIEALQRAAPTAPAVAPASTATTMPAAPAQAATAPVGSAAAAIAEAQPAAQAPSSDEAYIETPRCTTCEECMHINNKMFVYDANKQAYIADLSAGTYRQLVEAAENCQVSIIHPGKPRDNNEPGIAELIERAKPFL